MNKLRGRSNKWLWRVFYAAVVVGALALAIGGPTNWG